jgi:hypothetical protein
MELKNVMKCLLFAFRFSPSFAFSTLRSEVTLSRFSRTSGSRCLNRLNFAKAENEVVTYKQPLCDGPIG